MNYTRLREFAEAALETEDLKEFLDACSPHTVLALMYELDAATAQAKSYKDGTRAWMDRAISAEKRLDYVRGKELQERAAHAFTAIKYTRAQSLIRTLWKSRRTHHQGRDVR